MKALPLSLLLSALALLITCANLAGVGGEGNGSETTAGGIIVDSVGVPMAGVSVQLLPADYDPVAHEPLPAEWRTFTNSRGEYRLGGIAAGTYALEAGSNSAGMKAHVKDVEITGTKTEVVMDTGRLQKTGTVFVRLIEIIPRRGDHIYLPGTSTSTVITARDSISGQAVLSDVPAGTFTDLFYVSQTSRQNTDLLKDTLSVPPGDTVATAYTAWKYSRPLFLNTTATGADIKGNVYKFPVLVRLTNTTFDFSQAQSGGEDLRFTKPDGSPLAHEIERWDPVNHTAEIWVNVDTVYGNDSAHFMTLYWGNPAAADHSNGPGVFDTTDNVSAVWHLNQSCKDATSNKHSGIESSASDAAGIIGSCKKFNGSDSIKIAGLLDSPSTFTLSAWAQLDSTSPGGGSEILSIGDAALIRMDYALGGIGTLGSIHQPGDSVYDNVKSGQFLKQTGWHLVTFTIDESIFSATLYIDGTKAASRTGLAIPPDYSGVGRNTYIGKHGNGKPNFNFIGRIDEVRAYKKPVSAYYVKLCYMNQRSDDKLVLFQ